MGTTVTVDVFSGRPNPSFVLDDQQEHELRSRLAGLNQPTTQRPSGALGGLGYRGFLVGGEPRHPGTAFGLRLHEGIIDQGPHAPNLLDGSDIESWLLSLSRPHLAPDVHTHVRQSAAARNVFALALQPGGACPPVTAADAPAYNPATWNAPTTQPHNNCYNYANNQITNSFAQPGRAHGIGPLVMNCASVQGGATADGLNSCANFAAALAPGRGWYVALVIWPGQDFHWYRQDDLGCWSHKPGATPARNYDNAGGAIPDPKTCNRGPYTQFCTYMTTTTGVKIFDPQSGMELELDIYSGRPNPSWVVDGARAAMLSDRMRSSYQRGRPAAPSSEPLGYRGVAVVAPDGIRWLARSRLLSRAGKWRRVADDIEIELLETVPHNLREWFRSEFGIR